MQTPIVCTLSSCVHVHTCLFVKLSTSQTLIVGQWQCLIPNDPYQVVQPSSSYLAVQCICTESDGRSNGAVQQTEKNQRCSNNAGTQYSS